MLRLATIVVLIVDVVLWTASVGLALIGYANLAGLTSMAAKVLLVVVVLLAVAWVSVGRRGPTGRS